MCNILAGDFPTRPLSLKFGGGNVMIRGWLEDKYSLKRSREGEGGGDRKMRIWI